jgi:hypothetical protein
MSKNNNDQTEKSNIIPFPTSIKVVPGLSGNSVTAVNGLKDNLKALNDLHSRLKFMLTELEDLIKR